MWKISHLLFKVSQKIIDMLKERERERETPCLIRNIRSSIGPKKEFSVKENNIKNFLLKNKN